MMLCEGGELMIEVQLEDESPRPPPKKFGAAEG